MIAACREQADGQAGEAAPPWLPPDVLTALAQHAPPPAPLTPLPSPAGHASTAPVTRPADGATFPPGPGVPSYGPGAPPYGAGPPPAGPGGGYPAGYPASYPASPPARRPR